MFNRDAEAERGEEGAASVEVPALAEDGQLQVVPAVPESVFGDGPVSAPEKRVG